MKTADLSVLVNAPVVTTVSFECSCGERFAPELTERLLRDKKAVKLFQKTVKGFVKVHRGHKIIAAKASFEMREPA